MWNVSDSAFLVTSEHWRVVVITNTFAGNCGQLHVVAKRGRPCSMPTAASGRTVSCGRLCLGHTYNMLNKNVKMSHVS